MPRHRVLFSVTAPYSCRHRDSFQLDLTAPQNLEILPEYEQTAYRSATLVVGRQHNNKTVPEKRAAACQGKVNFEHGVL